MQNLNVEMQKEKQKSDSSRMSIYVFIGSSIYFNYKTNWIHLFQFKTILYFLIGIFLSGILLGMINYYLSKLISNLLIKTMRNPKESNIEFYKNLSLILGIPLLILGFIIDFQFTKLFFNWWY